MPNVGKDVEQLELSYIADENVKIIRSLRETIWQCIKKNIYLLYELATVLLGIYQRELKAYGHTKTCICIFIAA